MMKFILISSLIIILIYHIHNIQTRETCQLNNAGSTFAEFDGNFSENACIVKNEFSAPDCNLAPPDYTVNATINPCPGIPTVVAPIIDGGQIIYATMEDAIAYCPYGLIQFVGTVYMSDIVSGHNFWYNQSIDFTLQGFPQVVTQGNTTITLNSAIVGFKNFQVQNPSIQVTLIDVYLEGCGTSDPIFLTRTPCPQCVETETNICPGAWFRRNDTILDAEFCQQTAAWFNGTQHISFQNYTSLTSDHYNGFHGSDAIYFQYTDNITLEAWINPHPDVEHFREVVAGNRRRSDSTDFSFGYGFYFENQGDGGQLRWGVKNPGKSEHYCRTPIPSGVWTHVAGTFSQGVVSMYINGQSICNVTAGYTTLKYRNVGVNDVNGDNGVRPFTIGAGWYDKGNGSDRDDYMGFFEGLIDEVRLWTVVRNPFQITAAMQTILSSLTPNLVIYMRFDSDFGFKANWATAVTGQPLPQFFNDFPLTDPDIWAVPDCFCQSELGSCTPFVGQRDLPYEAVTSITVSDTILNYEFIVGMLINPNDDYGQVWLPGKTSTSGPIYNEVVRFVPGAYLNWLSPHANDPIVTVTEVTTVEFNATTNTTTNVTTNVTTYTYPNVTTNASYQFIPGVNLALLPPFYDTNENPYLMLDYFLPGWFLNDGLPPFLGSNFFPGIFVPINESTVPVPTDWEPGDLIFQPGYYFFSNNTWVPFPITSPYYIVPIVVYEGISFNATLDLDNCTNPGLTVSDTSVNTPVIETLLGCTVSDTDIEPTYLDPFMRDPCFVLRDIRSDFPAGTENIDPELLLGCKVGPDDIEPTWLDPLNRNPCFVLRDIRAAIPVNATCPNGDPPLPPVYMPCLKNQNLTLSGVVIQNYNSEKVVCQHACDENVHLVVANSTFAGIPGSAIWSSGLNGYQLYESSFCPCGGATEACIYLNDNHIADGDALIYNIRHCAIQDLLPISCSYPLTQTLYCNQSQVYCLDVFATISSGCPEIEVSPGVFLFDNDCATYGPCTCGSTTQLVELPDGSFMNISTSAGDIVIPVEYTTPSLRAFGNSDSNFVTFPCATEDVNISVTYPCQVEVNETVTIGNETIVIPTLVDDNCTAYVTVQTASSQAITCPCPSGYNVSADTTLTGLDAYNYLGLYQTCQWDIPGGLPGETCLDGVVQCPYLGGTLGDGTPPPAPLYVCDPSTGTAKFACSDCVAGQITFEGYNHTCPASCTAPNTTVTIFEDVCYCLDFYMTFACNRLTCFNATSCPANDTLCSYYGTFTWDSVGYVCYVDVNATDCIGVSYAPNYPVSPVPNGTIAIPCTTTYQLPSPGPCSCSPQIVSDGNNVTIPCDGGTNCTNATVNGVYSDPSLQIMCQPNGQLSCRCDGIQALSPFSNSSNLTFVKNSSAIWIDHVPTTTRSWYMQNVVTQQLPIGVRFTRFPDDNVWNFPIIVPHFWSGHFVLSEMQRISPWVTGTLFDWVMGYDAMWDFRNCSYIYPMTPENNCKQYRPTEADSCVVDSTYDATQTPDFNVLRFDKVKKAINNCPRNNIIIHKATNAYEEQIVTDKSNMWIGSYDNAVIVGEGHAFTGDNVTLRGITWIHTGTSHTPMITPGTANDNYLSALFDDDQISNPPSEFRLYNNYFNGHSVNDAGVMVGLFGKHLDVSYNLFEGWYTRTIYVSAPFSVINLNTFRKCPGRAFFAKGVKAIRFEKNQCIDCSGMKVTKYLETFSIRAYGDIGSIHKNALGQLIFQNFSEAEFNEAFDVETSLAELDHDIGCNATFDSNRLCTYRGNKHITTDIVNTPSHSIVCHALRGGAWHLDNVTDNTCNFARIGFLFAYTPLISYLNRTQVSHKNFLVQPMLTLPSSFTNGADQAYTSVGSLVSLGCAMPDCVADNVWPPLEVNPRCDLIVTPDYGFSCMNNVTAAVQYGKELNTIEVTSGVARLRRDNLVFGRDAFIVGISDPFCCEKPVIYGDSHLFSADITVMESIEMRFELRSFNGEEEEDSTGDLWMYTPQSFLAGQIRFLDMNFDGRNIIGSSVVRISYFFLDPATSVFHMQDSQVYNWWNLPSDTVRGVYSSVKGNVDVVVIPSENLIFYEKRLPGIEGFTLLFKQFTTSTKRHVKKSNKNPLPEQDSMAIIINNTFTGLDGNTIWLEFPGNWEFDNNTFIDCGNRRPMATEVVMLTGNMDSSGSYYCRNNLWNTSKLWLWPHGGANTKGNGPRKSALTIQDLLFPFEFEVSNNTVVLNAPYDIHLAVPKNKTSSTPIISSSGFFSNDGPLIFGNSGTDFQTKEVTPFNKSAAEILQRSTDPKDLTGGGGTITEGIAYVDLDDTVSYMELENNIVLTPNTVKYAGYPIAGRFNIPPPVAYKVMHADTLNLTYLFLQEPGLLPLMLIAIANNKNTAKDYLSKGYALPQNSPGGFEGYNADLVSCYGYKDYMEDSLQQCNTCNDGCPIRLPPACLIDAQNISFVPENPYYGTWYFTSLAAALQGCADPNKEIWMYDQNEPITEQFILYADNWTIRSRGDSPTRVLVSLPVLIAADGVTLDGFNFLHNTGNNLPTLVSTGSPQFVTLINNTFNGSSTTMSAITGTYVSIAIVNNTFYQYEDSERLVWLISDCGTLVFQRNKIWGVKKTSLYASNYNALNGYKNTFYDCGGESASVVYFSICHDTATSVIWSRNKQYRNNYFSSLNMYRASYWLDGVPIANRSIQHIDLRENSAKGLDVGIRVTNTDDLDNALNHRATIFFYLVNSNNMACEGKWHYIVWSPIPNVVNDLLISQNPPSTEKYWCDADCQGDSGAEVAFIVFGSVIAFFAFYLFFTCWCCLYNPIISQIGYSEVLGHYVAPRNPALNDSLNPLSEYYYQDGNKIYKRRR